MHALGRFFAFWYDFIVGDDWVLAVGVVVALLVAAIVARSEASAIAWVTMPIAIVVILSVSLRGVLRSR
jgi:hypothetical protein